MENGKLVVHFNEAAAAGDELSRRDYEGVKLVENPDSAIAAFYVAKAHDGVLVGTVQVGGDDRAAAGALVGNWVARGLIVERMDAKELAKLLREQQKKSSEPAAPAEPAQPGAGGPPAAAAAD